MLFLFFSLAKVQFYLEQILLTVLKLLEKVQFGPGTLKSVGLVLVFG